jgi:hypothetical protein
MKTNLLVFLAGVSLAMALPALPAAAQPPPHSAAYRAPGNQPFRDYRDPRDYRDYRDYRDQRGNLRDRDEALRRSIVVNRARDLRQQVRQADRSRRLPPREATNLNRTLERLLDELRRERYFSISDYDRRMRELDRVERDLLRHSNWRGGPIRGRR